MISKIPLFILGMCLHALPLQGGVAEPPKTATASASPLAENPTRTAFLKLIDQPRVPLAPEIKDLGEKDGLHEFHFTYAAAPDQRVTGLLTEPAKRADKLPVVIMLHGTGGKKEDLRAQMDAYAQVGFIAVAIDARYHGERAGGTTGSTAYQNAILAAWQKGSAHPFFYDTAWDVMRLVDYLDTRDDVDPKRIGVMGISMGGIETYLAAAADPRIAVVVPFISLESFKWALDHDLWSHRTETIPIALAAAAKDAGVTEVDAAFVRKFYDKVAPGIYGQFDGPSMITLIAPRPLLAINGANDLRTPLEGVNECLNAARPLYHAANADDRLVYIAQPNTAHAVKPESYVKAREWFVQWLQPTTK
jgi:dienelactone hydrolase